MGTKVGDSKTFTLRYPDDYANADLAGTAVAYSVTIGWGQFPINPEATEIRDWTGRIAVNRGAVSLSHGLVCQRGLAHPIHVDFLYFTSHPLEYFYRPRTDIM